MNSPPPSFSAALWPDPHRACGVVLRPLCLGHALLLQRLGNPLIPGVEPAMPGYGDVLQVAYVVSRPWAAAARGVQSWTFRAWVRWKLRVRWWKEEADREALFAYLRAQWPAPDYWRDEKDAARSRQRGLDLLQILLAGQRERWGKTFSQAMATPLALAIWDQLDHAEREGVIRLWTPAERQAAARLRDLAEAN